MTPPCARGGVDVSLGTTFVCHERAGLLGLLAPCEYPSCLRVRKIKIAELADALGMTLCLLGFGGIGTVRYAAKNALCFLSGGLGCPWRPMSANGMKALSVFRRPVENNVTNSF
jgi:hypothetical protein